MLNWISIDTVRRLKIQPRQWIAIGISTVFVLSIFHHIVNFWGLSWMVQLLILALIPILAVPINFLTGPMWERAVSTSWKRWLLFLIPVLIITTYMTWRVFESPRVWHSVEITAAATSGQTQVQLIEIRDSSHAAFAG